MAKKIYTVAHSALALSVGGKLQKMPLGSEIELDEVAAKNLLKTGKIVEKEQKEPKKVGK